MTSNTSLYGSTTTNGNVGSTNFTTLYSGSGTSIKPTTGYGNANVERFLNAGTDGANVIANIIANGTITSAGNITAPWFIGNVVGNISGNIVVPGSNTAVLYNNNGNAGASDALKFNFSSNVLTANGNIVANYFIGNGSGLSSLTGANVTGQVGYAAVANSVAVANVVGIGNIATINLNGNGSQVLLGNGAWGNGGGGNASNANYANFAGTAFNVSGSNVSGDVSGANHANVADVANSVAVANVSGIGNIATVNLDGNASNILFGNGTFSAIPVVSNVANANYANFAGQVVDATQSNITGVGTLGNLTVSGNVFAPAIVQNASSYDTRVSLSSAAGIVEVTTNGNSTQFKPSGQISLSGASQIVGGTFDGSGITLGSSQTDIIQNRGGNVTVQVGTGGTIANTWNFNNDGNLILPGNIFAVKYANGTVVNLDGPVANANYANFAGDVVNSTQSNITSLGNLVDLRISNSNIHLGSNAGVTTQSANSIAIGTNAGLTNQGNGITNARSIAIGFNAANTNQGDSAVAIGRGAGQNVQANHSVALGWSAAGNNQGSNSIAIGTVAGNTFQGNYAVAIGVGAGRTNQANNSIVLNASGSNLDQTIANTFTVKPVRANLTGNVLFYDTTSGEISYDVISNISNVSTANYANFAGTLINGNSNISIVANANVNMSISGNANVIQIDGNGSILSSPIAGGFNNWIRTINYGIAANGNSASASRISSFRYRGNSAANLSVQPNDGTLDILTGAYNGSILQTNSLARIRATVDNSYVANGANIPLGWQIVVNDTNGGINNQAKTHNFYSNGNVTFGGNVTSLNVSTDLGAGNIVTSGAATVGTTLDVTGQGTFKADVNFFPANLSAGSANLFLYNGNLNVANNGGNTGGTVSLINLQGFGNVFGARSSNGYMYGTTIRATSTISGDADIRLPGAGAANVQMFAANGAINATGTVTANNFVGNLTGNTTIANLSLTKFQETVVSGGTVSGTLTPNSSAGTIYNYTLNGNITINSLGNAVAGTSMTLILTQDGTGGRTLTSTMKFSDGFSTLSTSAGAVDIISVFYSGTTYYATLTTGYA